YFAGVNWPYLLSVYNALGFFLLLVLFLWRPAMHYLGTQGKKTAVAIRNSRDARQEAADYRDKYRALAGDIDRKGAELREQIRELTEADREAMILAANRQAEEIAGGVEAVLRNEESELSGRIGSEAAVAACDRARIILESRLGEAEHDIAIEELIADIAGMELESAPA
ncbi:MAG: hypothetical protein LBS30_05365, partial [Planctomycetota bacterium]|nr:hypothetical protein [Planctomycetota bacterium]